MTGKGGTMIGGGMKRVVLAAGLLVWGIGWGGEVERLKEENDALKREVEALRAENQRLRARLVEGGGNVGGGERGKGGGEFWISEPSKVRHNSRCRYFKKTRGRAGGAKEGRPCKVCGG